MQSKYTANLVWFFFYNIDSVNCGFSYICHPKIPCQMSKLFDSYNFEFMA